MSSAVVCLERKAAREKWVARATRPPRSATCRLERAALDQGEELPVLSQAAAALRPAGRQTEQASGLCYLIHEDTAYGGFANDYVRSKRACEQMVLQSPIDSVVLRPSIVLSHGVNSPEFARSVLWVLPVIHSLGVLPLTGDEPIDVVSVQFVADAVVRMLEQPLRHRVYHISAGPDGSITLKEIFAALTQSGRDYSEVRFEPDMDWKTFGQVEARLRQLKEFLNYYLPFLGSGVVYDCSRLKQMLDSDFPSCPKLTDHCAQLLDLFTQREAFAEAVNP